MSSENASIDRRTVDVEVARIWSEVLGVNQIDPDGEFFLLGGDSMLAAEVVAIVRERLGLPATLRLLFENPEFRDFVASIADRGECIS